jgi:hypothetical protein
MAMEWADDPEPDDRARCDDAEPGAPGLAFAVLMKALADALNPQVGFADRASARAFLTTENPRFVFWCEVAHVRAEVIARAATARRDDARHVHSPYRRLRVWRSRPDMIGT